MKPGHAHSAPNSQKRASSRPKNASLEIES